MEVLSQAQLVLLKEKILNEREINLNFMPQLTFSLEDRKCSVDIANSEVLEKISTVLNKRVIDKEKKFLYALSKISKKTYGICEECRGPIGFRRLFINPSAELCVICKEDAERG